MSSSFRCIFRSVTVVAVALALLAGSIPVANAALSSEGAGYVQGVDRASYTVSPNPGRPRSRFIATLRNEGTSTIEVGNPYVIARRTSDGWRRLRHGRRCAWTMEAYILRPGNSFTQRVGWLGRDCDYRRLEPGTYRVSKWIRYTDSMSSYREGVVRARFRVN